MQNRELPIGIFDSGVGGVSVLKELVRLMPNENYIYLGDSKHAPYGTKSHEEIFLHAENCAKYLLDKGVKALVVACNTATSVCIDDLRLKYPDVPIIGIEPALKPAVMHKDKSTVIVMATPLTLKEKKFAGLCANYSMRSRIIPLPCPGLMELVEEGKVYGEETTEFLRRCFKDINLSEVDGVVLGCTHYPFVKKAISELIPGAAVFDGGEGTARQVRRLLNKNKLLRLSDEKGTVIFENTAKDDNINELARKLLDN